MEIRCGDSSLGCSVAMIYDLDGLIQGITKEVKKPDGWGGFYTDYQSEEVNVFDDSGGYEALKKWVMQEAGNKTTGYSGIILFTDTTRYRQNGGAKLAKLLRDYGEHVEETEFYKNPRHTGQCKTWVWYFRKRRSNKNGRSERLTADRSLPNVRRKAAQPKVKAA